MGIGKTEWAIQYMNTHPNNRFMYVTPFNSEVEYVISKCPELGFKLARKGHKEEDFKTSLLNDENIIATHECIKRMDQECVDLLEASNYTLILDEVAEVVLDLPISPSDVEIILNECATVDENGFLIWHKESYDKEKDIFAKYRSYCGFSRQTYFQNSKKFIY
jgi:hypothetical protein